MRAAVLLVALVLAGCATRVQTVRVQVSVPVECRVEMPARPAMPTESLPADALLDPLVQAALAEIDRREAYELELVAALQECRKPISSLRQEAIAVSHRTTDP